MAARVSSQRSAAGRSEGGGNYFAAPKSDIQFIPSGCQRLDLALGGGWAENRVCNIVGDKSTGKTLLAIEAAANFCIKYPKGKIRYRECEAAFDPKYARALGMPMERVDFGPPLETVEDLFEDLQAVIKGAKQPELYIVDSLDALSDRAEMERSLDEGTYGANKPKQLSQTFRRVVRALAASHVTLMVISQVRSKIGVSFGRGTTRSGGRALDFYASQVAYLSSGAPEYRTFRGEKRAVGIDITARIDKNKIALPFRDAKFQIIFGYGIDDLGASLDWLKHVGALGEVGLPPKLAEEALTKIKRQRLATGELPEGVTEAAVREVVRQQWYEIEGRFLPPRSKYGPA